MTERPFQNNAHHTPEEHQRQDITTNTQPRFDDVRLSSGEARRFENATVVEALVRLVNDTKIATRTIAVTELERLLPRAAESAELRASIVRQIPRLTAAIRVANDIGVLTDLFRIAGEFGHIGERESCACGIGSPSKQERTTELIGLTSAIVAKLYEPNRSLPDITAESGVIALTRFLEISAPVARPLLHAFERIHPSNTRIAYSCEQIRRCHDERVVAEVPSVRGLSSLAALFGFRGLSGRSRWTEVESAAVATLIEASNAPPDLPLPIDPISSALRAECEQRLRGAIVVLGRFAVRNRRQLDLGDSVQIAIALSTCLSSPIMDSSAITALSVLGAGATPALPALIEVAGSRRYSHSTRGEAFGAIGQILAHSPDIDCSDARGLGGRFLETAARALRGSNPLLVQKILQALTLIGPRAFSLAPSIERALLSELDATPSLGENVDAVLQPVALIAIEALAAIDPSGHTAATTFTRIFEARRTPDDIRHQLIVTFGELAEREEVPLAISDTISAGIIESRYLAGYLVEEALAMVERIEATLDLHPAEMPLATTALLRSQNLDIPTKEARLLSLVTDSERFPESIRRILIAAYPEISPVARLDDIALETLRRLRR